MPDRSQTESQGRHAALARICYIGQLASAAALVIVATLFILLRDPAEQDAYSPLSARALILAVLLVSATGFGIASIFLRHLRLRELSRRHRDLTEALCSPRSIIADDNETKSDRPIHKE